MLFTCTCKLYIHTTRILISTYILLHFQLIHTDFQYIQFTCRLCTFINYQNGRLLWRFQKFCILFTMCVYLKTHGVCSGEVKLTAHSWNRTYIHVLDGNSNQLHYMSSSKQTNKQTNKKTNKEQTNKQNKFKTGSHFIFRDWSVGSIILESYGSRRVVTIPKF